MRAKMSGKGRQDHEVCKAYGFGCQCAENAVAEARAILAETEPDDDRNASGYGLTTAQFGIDRLANSFPGDVKLALAESLAAFVEAS